jgi:uncharacterized protein DUF2304
MTSELDLATLKHLLADQPVAHSTRAVALLVSGAFLASVLHLVRTGRLREEYTPIWTVVALGIMTLSVWSEALRAITRIIGAWAPSSTLFFFGQIVLLAICLNYAVRLSTLTLRVTALAQELALLRADLRRGDEPPA